MAYQMTNPHGQTMVHQQGATTIRSSTLMSKWWPISFFIAALVFAIIGGGLIGAWSSSTDYSCDDYSCYGFSNDGEFYGGAACFAIAGVCKLVGWILFIIRCVRANRPVQTTTVMYQPLNPYTAPAPQPAYVPVPLQSSTPAPEYPGAMRYCGHCGSMVSTSFCTQCGVKG